MPEFFLTITTATALFATTNLDDILVLTVLFLAHGTTGRPAKTAIIAGQFTGIGVLVAVALAAALGLSFVPVKWVGLLGVLPLCLGLVGLVDAFRSRNNPEQRPKLAATGFLGVAGITIANGADNITLYTPLFHNLGLAKTITTIIVFAVLTAVWCLAAARLGSHKQLVRIIGRFGHWVVPMVFIAIGAIILAGSNF